MGNQPSADASQPHSKPTSSVTTCVVAARRKKKEIIVPLNATTRHPATAASFPSSNDACVGGRLGQPAAPRIAEPQRWRTRLDRPIDGNDDMSIASETQNTPEKLIPIHRRTEWQVSHNFVTNHVRESPVRPQSANHTSHTILLMGEDPLMLRALTRLLRKAGYTVVTHEACSAIPEPQALEVAEARMVVVDVPDDWRERGIKQVDDLVAPNDGQSILWIGNSGEAEAYGPFHLIKPFSGSQFLSAIEVTLNSLSLTSGGSEVYGAKSGELDKSAN